MSEVDTLYNIALLNKLFHLKIIMPHLEGINKIFQEGCMYFKLRTPNNLYHIYPIYTYCGNYEAFVFLCVKVVLFTPI